MDRTSFYDWNYSHTAHLSTILRLLDVMFHCFYITSTINQLFWGDDYYRYYKGVTRYNLEENSSQLD